MKKFLLWFVIIVGALSLLFYFNWPAIQNNYLRLNSDDVIEGVTLDKPADQIDDSALAVTVIAEHLNIPWEMVFLPDGDLLVTERPGILKRVGQNQQVYEIKGVKHLGEGGLLGMALHPLFADNQWLYLYFTTATGESLTNRVERYRLADDRLIERKIIIENIPGANYHDGGRLAFGPDGFLYISTGDATRENLAQDVNSLAGKILRVSDEGLIPGDNPFGNAVYSYGHRNVQGITWDSEGQLWATEHGRSGILSGFDELNKIVAGGNYGWPEIQGDEKKEGMIEPVLHSGPRETWAPAGLTFVDGSLFFVGLRGQTLYEVPLRSADGLRLKGHFKDEFGRLRAVVLGPDRALYLATSNTDGRGESEPNDDRIIRVPLELLK